MNYVERLEEVIQVNKAFLDNDITDVIFVVSYSKTIGFYYMLKHLKKRYNESFHDVDIDESIEDLVQKAKQFQDNIYISVSEHRNDTCKNLIGSMFYTKNKLPITVIGMRKNDKDQVVIIADNEREYLYDELFIKDK